MADHVEAYANRVRAESFGSIAENYDRYRPSYPAALIDDLVALSPSSVLDVGCGTGKAAVLLAARGLSVLGVEIDERMADVARSHGLAVEVGAFETWDAAGRSFDLIVSGQAWHWIDPTLGVPKAVRLLRPGGTLALFWNFYATREPLATQIDVVYRKHVPELMSSLDALKEANRHRPYLAPLESSGLFSSIETRKYPWEHLIDTASWIGMVRTHSDHLMLAPDRREALLADVTAVIDASGGQVANDVTTYLILATAPGAE